MKRKCAVLALSLLLLLLQGCAVLYVPPSVVAYPADLVLSDEIHLANHQQKESAVWMAAYHQQLYFYSHTAHSTLRTRYQNWLCTITEKGIEKLCQLADGKLVSYVGQSGQYLYYTSESSKELYCYDLQQRKETLIVTTALNYQEIAYFSSDGSVFFQLRPTYSQDAPQYLQVKGNEVIMQTDKIPAYCLGDRSYSYIAKPGSVSGEIFSMDIDKEQEQLELPVAARRALLPCNQGLLITMHDTVRFSICWIIAKNFISFLKCRA